MGTTAGSLRIDALGMDAIRIRDGTPLGCKPCRTSFLSTTLCDDRLLNTVNSSRGTLPPPLY
jgi:hypothetical protein